MNTAVVMGYTLHCHYHCESAYIPPKHFNLIVNIIKGKLGNAYSHLVSGALLHSYNTQSAHTELK